MGEQDDRQAFYRADPSDLPAHFETVHLRHQDVADDEVGRVGEDMVQCFNAVIRDKDAIAMCREYMLQKFCLGRTVVDYQYLGSLPRVRLLHRRRQRRRRA